MKNYLLGTTAIVAAGMLAVTGPAHAQAKKSGPIKIGISGYMEQWVGVADNDDENDGVNTNTGFDEQADAELWFTGSTTLDNGIKVGVRIELEGNTDGGPANQTSHDQIDESSMYVQGSFGRINLGGADNAAMAMHFQAFDIGIGNFDAQAKWVQDPTERIGIQGLERGVRFNTIWGRTAPTLDDSHADKITYYTPRVEGFQFGVSWIPNFDEDNSGSIASVSNGYHDGLAVGANFVRRFDKVRVALSAGYITAKYPPITDVPTNNPGSPSTWSVGGSVSMGPMRFAGSYGAAANTRLDRGTTIGTSTDGDAHSLGAYYRFGKNMVGVTYWHSEVKEQVAVAGDSTMDLVTISGRHSLGNGVSLRATLLYLDIEGEDTDGNTNSTGTSGGARDDNSGWAFVTGVRVSF